MPIRVGLVGYGLSGSTFHAPFLDQNEAFSLQAIVSSRHTQISHDYPNVTIFPSLDEMLAASNIDLVVITTVNTAHYEQARKAILAGKHVVVEKPFVIHVAEGKALIELAQEQGVLLSVYQNRRWDGDFLTVRGVLSGGLLGQIASYEAHFDRFRPLIRARWQEQDFPGSEAIYDLGSHLIDQGLVLFGPPSSIQANLLPLRQNARTRDYFHIVLHYAHHEVILHSSPLVREIGPHFQIHGSQGSFIKYGMDPQEEALRSGLRPGTTPHWGEDTPEDYGTLSLNLHGLSIKGKVTTLPGSYTTYYTALAEAITANKDLPVRAEEALDTTRVIELALRSQQEQRTIPFDADFVS